MLAAEDASSPGTRFSRLVLVKGRAIGAWLAAGRARGGFGIAVLLRRSSQVACIDWAAPRSRLVHTWTNTQNEGWFRVAFDRLQIPYDYISDQKLKATANLATSGT